MAGLIYLNGLTPEPHIHKGFEDRALSEFETEGVIARHMEIDHRHLMFGAYMDDLTAYVDAFADEYGETAVAGHSAGGSVAVNLAHKLADREDVSFYSIAGRVKIGEYPMFHPRELSIAAHMGIFALGGAEYYFFKDSVITLDHSVLPNLSDETKSRIKVLKPKHDQVVPRKLMDIDGVETVVLPARTHKQAAVHGLRYILDQMKDELIAV